MRPCNLTPWYLYIKWSKKMKHWCLTCLPNDTECCCIFELYNVTFMKCKQEDSLSLVARTIMGRYSNRVASFNDFTTSAEDISRWDATLCRLVHSYTLSETSCYLHLQIQAVQSLTAYTTWQSALLLLVSPSCRCYLYWRQNQKFQMAV